MPNAMHSSSGSANESRSTHISGSRLEQAAHTRQRRDTLPVRRPHDAAQLVRPLGGRDMEAP